LRDDRAVLDVRCEACGRLCRREEHGRHPIAVFFRHLRSSLPISQARNPKSPPEP
jgi:hypothetical protein